MFVVDSVLGVASASRGRGKHHDAPKSRNLCSRQLLYLLLSNLGAQSHRNSHHKSAPKRLPSVANNLCVANKPPTTALGKVK